MRVSPHLLIDLAKGPDGTRPRTFTVTNPLPMDTTITDVGWDLLGTDVVCMVVLESAEWDHRPAQTMLDPPPTWSIYYPPPPIPPEDRDGSAGEVVS
jgi:hypothetical protein